MAISGHPPGLPTSENISLKPTPDHLWCPGDRNFQHWSVCIFLVGLRLSGKGVLIIYVTQRPGEIEGGLHNVFLLSEWGYVPFLSPARGA